MGAAARNRGGVWRAADLCIPPLDHVFAQGLLFLRSAKEKISRGVHYAGASDQGAAGAERDPRVKVEVCEHDPNHT